jgi:hypothetical protein
LLLCACASAPRVQHFDNGEPYRAANLSIRLAFDTGPGWWTDPDKECPVWSQALLIARQMAGCSEDYVGDPAQKCQAAIRKCSPGCDVCRNLKPGSGPDATFGPTRQPRGETCYANTWGPGFFAGYDTKFDQRFICTDARLLAKVMIHESVHACRAAGGTIDLRDEQEPFRLGRPGCYADTQIALFRGDKECGDPP